MSVDANDQREALFHPPSLTHRPRGQSAAVIDTPQHSGHFRLRLKPKKSPVASKE
jgi:hypothetical protein